MWPLSTAADCVHAWQASSVFVCGTQSVFCHLRSGWADCPSQPEVTYLRRAENKHWFVRRLCSMTPRIRVVFHQVRIVDVAHAQLKTEGVRYRNIHTPSLYTDDIASCADHVILAHIVALRSIFSSNFAIHAAILSIAYPKRSIRSNINTVCKSTYVRRVLSIPIPYAS